MALLFPLLLSLIPPSLSSFHPQFESFLQTAYSPTVADLLSRKDLGPSGSYGGRPHPPGQRANQQAVILVHGITNSAATFAPIKDHLEGNGHEGGSVYATTYGDAGKTAAPFVPMECSYVRQVRMLIQAVAAYTRRKVDVIAFSMGAPIARKAILGGACVDNQAQLGPPLTSLVDTFVSVAGANHGSFLCLLPFPGTCNMVNGLNCNSAFIRDINSHPHYEGSFVFSIYSQDDDKVGMQTSCGLASPIPGQNADFVRRGNHDQVMFSSAPLQTKLILSHSP